MNPWCVNYNQYIQNRIIKKITHKSNKLSLLQTGKKATRSVKKNKNNFIIVIGGKFVTSIT